MTIRLVDAGWATELTNALRDGASKLRVICPFIKVGALDRLLSRGLTSIQVITPVQFRPLHLAQFHAISYIHLAVPPRKIREESDFHA